VNGPYEHGWPAYARADIAALLGNRDRAVALLDRARADGLAYAPAQHTDAEFVAIRDYPPYAAPLRRATPQRDETFTIPPARLVVIDVRDR